ncbi:MAG: rhomboid family intramembrane serine protease [Deltaproteobacteria bacterium]|nr:rhomboid family intramembrane serine protease [Deltaproteobacteria bacterium]
MPEKVTGLMRALFENLTTDQANTCGLVLSSSGISYRVKKGKKGWEIWVDEKDYDSALDCMKQFFKENRDDFSKEGLGEKEFQKTYTGIWAALLLLIWYLVFLSADGDVRFVLKYGASATKIMRGEWFRLVTALMIHADGVHLIGNMVGIVLFGTAVCGFAGWGVGWLMILLTGILGNFFNALLLRAGHVSIGASTAVFGAIGILSGYRFLKLLGGAGKQIRAWLPVAGGLALLGFLGSGSHSDITAHLFGFVSGLTMGAIYALKVKLRQPRSVQRYALSALLVVITIAWLEAFSQG